MKLHLLLTLVYYQQWKRRLIHAASWGRIRTPQLAQFVAKVDMVTVNHTVLRKETPTRAETLRSARLCGTSSDTPQPPGKARVRESMSKLVGALEYRLRMSDRKHSGNC
jgi:hypothetical protein